MQKDINSIVRVYPDFEEKISFLFQTDEVFRDLCKDYILCASNGYKMKKEKASNVAQLEENEGLELSLNQEIVQMIIN
jgi:hypothetical protein